VQELVTFLAGITAVLIPVAALASEGCRRHRAAIAETLTLAETFRDRDTVIAARFDARALQLANDYLDGVEQQPRTYPKVVTAAAIAFGISISVYLGTGSSDADGSSSTVAAARGLSAGALTIVIRPLVADGWNRLNTWVASIRCRQGLP
jgi:Flp pilus assembly protein TadB